MGLRGRTDTVEPDTEAYDGPTWEYHARNLSKVAGMAIEDDFNKRGRQGWEFVAVADGYAIFKRRLTD